MPSQADREIVAVYGATGYTGRRVCQALLERGQRIVLAGRDRAGLMRVATELGGTTPIWPTALDDQQALHALCEQAALVINCAGPFDQTAAPLVRAAIDARAHYLDVSGEQSSCRFVFEQAAPEARAAGVALLPGFAFFSLGDLLAALLAAETGGADQVTIAYAVSNWRPSHGTLQARLRGLAQARYEYADGIRAVRAGPATELFDFPAPLWRRRVTPYPTPDAFSVARHVTTARVRTLITTSTLIPDPFGAMLPTVSKVLSAGARSAPRALEALLARIWRASGPGAMRADPSAFTVAVHLDGPAGRRTGHACGRGIYDVTAPMVAAAAAQVLRPDFDAVGALAPAQAVDPRAILDSLRSHGLRYELHREFQRDHEPRSSAVRSPTCAPPASSPRSSTAAAPSC